MRPLNGLRYDLKKVIGTSRLGGGGRGAKGQWYWESRAYTNNQAV